MPLRKSASKKEDADERLKRYHGRKAAEKKYGKAAIKGKTVHHKDGDNTNNSPNNLGLKTRSAHGKEHGRGNGKRGTGTVGKAKAMPKKAAPKKGTTKRVKKK